MSPGYVPEWRLGGAGAFFGVARIFSLEILATGLLAMAASAGMQAYVLGDTFGIGDATETVLALGAGIGIPLAILAWVQWEVWRPSHTYVGVRNSRLILKLPYPSTHPAYALLELFGAAWWLWMNLTGSPLPDFMATNSAVDVDQEIDQAVQLLGFMTMLTTGCALFVLLAATRLLAWYVFHRRLGSEATRPAWFGVLLVFGAIAALAITIAIVQSVRGGTNVVG